MFDEPPIRRVRVSFVGTAPARQVERASGVSEVETDGSVLRCLVYGSFQPFLEALRGHEVVGLDSTPAARPAPVPSHEPIGRCGAACAVPGAPSPGTGHGAA